MTITAIETKSSASRAAILATSSRLFYEEGIRSVGVDRIVDEARSTRATFYRHFPSKDDLVVAYLRERSAAYRAALSEGRGLYPDTGPDAARRILHATLAAIDAEGSSAAFRGCPFINAAAEFSDPAHPARLVVDEHRRWFHDSLEELLTDAGNADPAAAAEQLVLLRDGAMVSGYLDDPRAAGRALLAAGAAIIDGR
ncbi:TetR/AcrR family transcriptional regulator [Compostimonas suwonensis]|uniref:AcrR family transcriptional regulator n=1 Tax=Compostimonas suwonensis TaxID=1048394 RepID=A0A2M9BTW1_9MICO|nr:TetR/AcrR family transcriptional regulator [Compostimonas suwonensis]PJJ61361.1 AcrR family transcriptional regulator [Compostimonas suwonensis]